MRKSIRSVLRLTTSLPVRVGIGAALLGYYFVSIQKYCEWMACTIYYNWDKPSVVMALLLSVVILGHAAFDLIRSLLGARPTIGGFETPPPISHEDLMQQQAKLSSQLYQDSTNDG